MPADPRRVCGAQGKAGRAPFRTRRASLRTSPRAPRERDRPDGSPATPSGRTHFRRPLDPERTVVPAPGHRSADRWSPSTAVVAADHDGAWATVARRGSRVEPPPKRPQAANSRHPTKSTKWSDVGHTIAVRDSQDALGPVLFFRQHAWRQFAAKVKTVRLNQLTANASVGRDHLRSRCGVLPASDAGAGSGLSWLMWVSRRGWWEAMRCVVHGTRQLLAWETLGRQALHREGKPSHVTRLSGPCP